MCEREGKRVNLREIPTSGRLGQFVPLLRATVVELCFSCILRFPWSWDVATWGLGYSLAVLRSQTNNIVKGYEENRPDLSLLWFRGRRGFDPLWEFAVRELLLRVSPGVWLGRVGAGSPPAPMELGSVGCSRLCWGMAWVFVLLSPCISPPHWPILFCPLGTGTISGHLPPSRELCSPHSCQPETRKRGGDRPEGSSSPRDTSALQNNATAISTGREKLALAENKPSTVLVRLGNYQPS